MTRSRTWTAGTAAVVVVILAVGWFFFISPKRTEASELRTQAADTESANAVVEASIRQLKLEQKELPAQRAEIAAIRRQLPEQPLEPALIRQIAAASREADVDLRSITPAALAGLANDPGVAYIGTTIVVRGDFSPLKAFLNELEENQRAFLVSGFTIAVPQDKKASKPNELQLTVNARVFVTTGTGAATTTATGTTSGAAPQPGTTPSSAAAADNAAGTAN